MHPHRGSVLVTGAAGRIGGVTVSHLTSQGWVVTALDGDFPGDLVAHRIIRGDARDEELVREALQGVDHVVHLAALPHPAAGRPREVFEVNVLSTFTVLVWAAELGVRSAVIASSINASGIPLNHHDVSPAYFPLDEDLPVDLDDWYSLSKQTDENTARMVSRRWAMPVVALRFPFTHTAEGLREHRRACIADPRIGAREGWSYLDVRDAARAIEAGLLHASAGATVVHVCAPDTLLSEPTERMLDRWQPAVPRRASFPGRTAPVSAERASKLLGFRAAYPLAPEPASQKD